jgi:hypothetical protein
MLILELIKNGGVGVLSTMPSIHKYVFQFHRIWTTRVKENNEEEQKTKRQKNEQPWTLAYTLVLQTMSFPLSCCFWFGPIGFPSKMMPCRLNHNSICLGPRSLSKVLGTNLKLLTNKNAWFHWALILGPLSKVALRICGGTTQCLKHV